MPSKKRENLSLKKIAIIVRTQNEFMLAVKGCSAISHTKYQPSYGSKKCSTNYQVVTHRTFHALLSVEAVVEVLSVSEPRPSRMK